MLYYIISRDFVKNATTRHSGGSRSENAGTQVYKSNMQIAFIYLDSGVASRAGMTTELVLAESREKWNRAKKYTHK